MSPKVKTIIAWVMAVLITGFFIMAGISKVTLDPATVSNFKRWGHGENFTKLIGGLEILGAIGLLIPRIWYLAALGLIGLMGGAAYTHLTVGDPVQTMAPSIGLIVALLIYILMRRK